MNLIELHILQSVPVSCLNRDDAGNPKSAVFGGANRARVSSQAWKRAIRVHARENFPELPFKGIRSRFLLEPLTEALKKHGAEKPEEAAETIAKVFSSLQSEKNRGSSDVTTAVFLSPAEIDSIAAAVVAGKTPSAAAKKAQRNDAADIALFGRMVANDSSLNVEAAALFAHALSTHSVDHELDFYTAVEENPRRSDGESSTDPGAAMMGNLGFTSATYYRYIALNIDQLAMNLPGLEPEILQKIVEAFLRSSLEAIPGAREATMNGQTRPGFVLGVRRQKGSPVQLVNAFERPVISANGVLEKSASLLLKEHAYLGDAWGVQPDLALVIKHRLELDEDTPTQPERVGLEDFVGRLASATSLTPA
ncbi:type I-E CRISPR-associated protein Cas7/Cse4/CasC [Haloferula chungangensis]|uniref:Type I-E CRISPR-associated protein Cas7/Cse4/CasC n=1 Tax=Haloferula chungangensis TaxID=1048331 RepID=A0ABW2L9L2_9BACT